MCVCVRVVGKGRIKKQVKGNWHRKHANALPIIASASFSAMVVFPQHRVGMGIYIFLTGYMQGGVYMCV